MRILVYGLTLLAALLFVWQFFGAKGTKVHIINAVLIVLFSVVAVTINTITVTLQRDLVWDMAFVTHTGLGAGFFLGLIATCVLGWQVKRGKELRVWHRNLAYITGMFFFLSLLAIPLIYFLR